MIYLFYFIIYFTLYILTVFIMTYTHIWSICMRVCTLRHSSNQNAPSLALSFFILLFILILLLIYLFIFFKISRYTCLSRSIYFAGCSINRRISRFLEKYRDYDRQTAMLSSRIRGNARRSSRSVATPAVHALLPIGD